jgi:hypothetical protein
LWKNHLSFVKHVPMMNINFITTAIIVSEQGYQALLSYCPSYLPLRGTAGGKRVCRRVGRREGGSVVRIAKCTGLRHSNIQ